MRLLCPWDSPGKNTGAGCRALLRGIFLTQGSSLSLRHCRQILYSLSQQRSPQPRVYCAFIRRPSGEELRPGSDWTGFLVLFLREMALSLIISRASLPQFLKSASFVQAFRGPEETMPSSGCHGVGWAPQHAQKMMLWGRKTDFPLTLLGSWLSHLPTTQ